MCLKACIPQSWWKFAILHATHCYNRMPVQHLKWEMPYIVLNRQLPDISHLQIFGCGAYVHIPKETCSNALSPKSELMVYLGHTKGIKAYTFMRTTNNTLFTSTTALFDETLFPKCNTACIRGTTHVQLPPDSQSPFDASEDTTPGDFNDPLLSKKESKVLLPDKAPVVPDPEPAPVLAPAPPPAPEPVSLRRSVQLRKIPTCPGNIYGEARHPTEIERDIMQRRTWTRMTDPTPGPSKTPMPGETTPSALSETLQPESEEEDKVDDILYLIRKGGVKFLDYLLAKAVPLDPESPNTANICEWTFRDILKMPSASQKEWKQACYEELESLHSHKVFELVNCPKGRKIIKNRWIFDLKTDL